MMNFRIIKKLIINQDQKKIYRYHELFAEYKDSRGKPNIKTPWSISNMVHIEDEMEIKKYESVHIHSEQGSEISSEEESLKTPPRSSYDESNSGTCSDEEEGSNDKDWGITYFDEEISTWTTKYDQHDVSKFKDQIMDKLFKDNKALHGELMAPIMVMSGSHSFSPCLDSDNHPESHDIILTSIFTLISNKCEHAKEVHHGMLQIKKAYNELRPDSGVSLYSDSTEDH